MSVVCFICNSSSELIESYNYNSTLGSGKTFQEVIAEILGESAARQTITARPLCSKCYERCVEYHGLWARLTRLKKELQATFLRPKIPTVTRQTLTRDSPKKMVCLPASKLKPVPPQYLFLNKSDLNTGKLTTPVKLQPKPMAITSSPKSTVTAVSLQTTPTKTTPVELATITKQPPTKNLTIDTSVLLSQLSEVKSNLTDELADITAVDESRKVTMPSSIILSSNTSSSILHFDVNNLPKDFLDNAVLSRTIEEENDAEVENNDEQPMEIDEDCSFTAPKNTEIPDSSTHQQEETTLSPTQANPSDEGTERHNVLEMSMLPDLDPVESQHGADYDQDGGEDDQDGADDDQDGGDDEDNGDEEYVVKKVEILDEEDDENTLLVQGEDGSLIRVMAGQKFLYGGNEISLIIPQDGDNDDTMDNNDNADSNDESHIELQVSGDEETANAIIAAAQEQGGAFIKVQSGEMYRVKSVKSKIETVSEEEKAAEPAKRFSDVVKKMGNCYKCVICMKELKSGSRRTYYQSREAAARHVRVTHRIDVHAPDKQTRLVSSDGTQLPTPSKKGGHECAECGKSFGSRNLLMEHMNQHTGTRPYACPKCGKTFASKYTYQAHLKTHEERLRLFRCSKDGCSKSFYTLQNLSQHEHTHEGIKSFKCQVCNKSFGTAHNLEVHGVVHSGLKPFSCSMCDKSFARKAEIRDHIRTHTGERPFACEICGATFAQRSNLQSHVRATHTQDKRHACEHCDKKFKRRRLLEYHIKACHTGERPFRCEVCNATFVYPEHYKKHAWIHSGERPFVCEVCGKSFNSRDNRNAHRFVHSDKKPYECLVCGAGYMRKPLLYAHMHTSGHMTESIVVNQPRVSVDDEPDSSALQFFETVNEAELELGDRKVKTVVSQEEDGIAKVYISSADGNNIKSENSAINLIEDSDTALITIAQNLEGSSKIEPSILASLANEELGKGAEIVANDENGGVIRLVQIQLPNGDNGWIAIN